MYNFNRIAKPTLLLSTMAMALLAVGCGGGGDAPAGAVGENANVVNLPTSAANKDNSLSGTPVTATFNQPMDPTTLNSSVAKTQSTFTLNDAAGNNVPGSVAMNADNTEATFTPQSSALSANTTYTARVSTAAKSADGTAMAAPMAWEVTTAALPSASLAPVDLGAAGTFAILTQSGVTDVFPSAINGDVGASPITGAAIGLTCVEVQTGKVYSVDAAGPLPCRITNATLLTTAVGNMQSAYNNAASRIPPDFKELGSGEIGGRVLVPGLYKWSTGVSISSDVTLHGNSKAIWIFQIAGNLTQANATKVTLTGGAVAKNVFWQSAGAVTIGTTAHSEGVMLAKTNIAVKTGASVTGRLLAQTGVTLQQNAVTQPAN